MNRLKGKSEDIDNLKEVIDLDKDMKKYQRNMLRKLKHQHVYQMGIFESWNEFYTSQYI
jgi:hypothetical protein